MKPKHPKTIEAVLVKARALLSDAAQGARWRSWLNTYRSADFTYVLDHQNDDGKLTIPQKRDLLAELVAQILECERGLEAA